MSKAATKASPSTRTSPAPGPAAPSHWASQSSQEAPAADSARDGALASAPGPSLAEVGVQQSNTQPPAAMSPRSESGKDATQLSTSEGKLTGKEIVFDSIAVPAFKTEGHRGKLYASRKLWRKHGYNRGSTDQRTLWIAHVGGKLDNIKAKLQDELSGKQTGTSHVFVFDKKHYYIGDLDTIATQLAIPKWGPRGKYEHTFDVDHIVELQLAGWPEDSTGNEIPNMELLRSSVNRSSGAVIKNAIDARVGAFNTATGGRYARDAKGAKAADAVEAIKASYDLVFEKAVPGKEGQEPEENDSWTMEQIIAGEQVQHLHYSAKGVDKALGKGKGKGKDNAYVFGNPAGGQPKGFVSSDTIDKSNREHLWLRPFEIVGKELHTEEADVTTPSLGHLEVEVPATGAWQSDTKRLDITRMPGKQNVGHIDKKQVLMNLRARQLSPIRVDFVDIDGDTGVLAQGVILADAPLFRGQEIPFELNGGQLTIEHQLGADALNIPAPFQIRQALLRIFAGDAGIGVEGSVDFGIDHVGEGHIEAGLDEQGLSLGGGFDFDSSIFDPASVALSYENQAFHGKADIGIPAGKVPGIDSAQLTVTVAGDTIEGTGTVKPSLPGFQQGKLGLSYAPAKGLGLSLEALFEQAPLDPTQVTLSHENGQLSGTVKTGISPGRIPGIESATITFEVKGASIVGAGTLRPAFPGLEQADVTVARDPVTGLSLTGEFAFDTGLFERADLDLGYEDGKVHGGGDLAVAKGRVPGVEAASLTVGLDDGQVSGKGTLEPSLPGLKQADVWFSHGPEAGYRIGGSLSVADIPHVQSGELTAEVSAKPGSKDYGLAASGNLTVGVAGLTVRAEADYDRGMFTVLGKTGYKRGKAAGSVEVGVTNRAVNKDGALIDRIGDRLRPFGRGAVTLALTDWLTGTAGIRLLPSGEIEIDGALEIPDQVDLFERKSLDKKLFSIDAPIPIFGPLRAKIGGGMSLDAGVGPGTLRDAGLHVTYNPAHPDQAKVRGKARIVVPADAGLTLFVRGSVGVGLVVASADLGLEVSGRMGIAGGLDNSIAVAWSPATGVSIAADATIAAQPTFRFAISGFASASLGFKKWEKKWELASYEYGSALRFAMKVPIRYDSARGFTLSWDAVEFETPNIDALALIEGLLESTGEKEQKEDDKQ